MGKNWYKFQRAILAPLFLTGFLFKGQSGYQDSKVY